MATVKQHVKGYSVKKTRVTYKRKKTVGCYTRTVTKKGGKKGSKQATL